MKISEVKPIPDKLKDNYNTLMEPFVAIFTKMGIHPNTFTTVGFLISCIGAYFAAVGELRVAAVFILLSGIFDTIDGKLARQSGQVTKFGALYDSALDRYAEVLFFFGLAYYFIRAGHHVTSVAVAVGLGGSLMVSYVRARAEGLGFNCSVGILQRAERLILLGIGGLIHEVTLVIAIWIIAVMSNVTAIQRIVYVWKEDRSETIVQTQD